MQAVFDADGIAIAMDDLVQVPALGIERARVEGVRINGGATISIRRFDNGDSLTIPGERAWVIFDDEAE